MSTDDQPPAGMEVDSAYVVFHKMKSSGSILITAGCVLAVAAVVYMLTAIVCFSLALVGTTALLPAVLTPLTAGLAFVPSILAAMLFVVVGNVVCTMVLNLVGNCLPLIASLRHPNGGMLPKWFYLVPAFMSATGVAACTLGNTFLLVVIFNTTAIVGVSLLVLWFAAPVLVWVWPVYLGAFHLLPVLVMLAHTVCFAMCVWMFLDLWIHAIVYTAFGALYLKFANIVAPQPEKYNAEGGGAKVPTVPPVVCLPSDLWFVHDNVMPVSDDA